MSDEKNPAVGGQVERRVGRLRWKKNPRETGLRSVMAWPRGSALHDGKKTYARVSALGGDWRGPVRGWYFVCSTDMVGEYANTCNEPAPDEATAKAQAMAFVKARIQTPNP